MSRQTVPEPQLAVIGTRAAIIGQKNAPQERQLRAAQM